jgi:DNA-binding NtrC family response regulator
MRRLDRLIRSIASKEVSITLVGESGSGKEVIARRVHDLSRRAGGPFVPINCAAIPESLFESELFGHERGAFTGASERARGKIEAAEGGTLFLDEIGEMPVSMQAKLLRFLENQRFMRVGGTTKITVDTRLISATLRPLDQEVRAGRFRADLYYRIQGISLGVPPLRERHADVAPLVQQFTAQLAAKHGVAEPKITSGAMAALRGYEWPGNVRELRNVVEFAVLLCDGNRIRMRDLPEDVQRAARRGASRDAAPVAMNTLSVQLDRPLDELIRRILDAALALERGNRSRAAERLGISVRTVQRHLKG